MTTEEKAAKWQMVEDHKRAKETLATLREQANKLAEYFETVGICLKADSVYKLSVEGEAITIEDEQQKRTVAQVPMSELNGAKIKNLVEEITKTEQERTRLTQSLRSAGLNIE
jgi:hypothetical protein